MNSVVSRLNKDIIYRYEGSLTAPIMPELGHCSENVAWHIIPTPIPISQQQVDDFNRIWKDNPEFAKGNGNNRPVQDLNGRLISISGLPIKVPSFLGK